MTAPNELRRNDSRAKVETAQIRDRRYNKSIITQPESGPIAAIVLIHSFSDTGF